MIAVAIWHYSDEPIIARRGMAKKHSRNERHHLTNAELVHRHVPRVITPTFQASFASVTKKGKIMD
jgi:hypothetical protein